LMGGLFTMENFFFNSRIFLIKLAIKTWKGVGCK
jgi:hypothetical protein